MGKGTVVRRLLEKVPDLAYSVSCTTREPRPGEVDGREYRFVSPSEFDRLLRDGAFLEWAEVFGHRYGTLLDPVRREIGRNRSVVLEIDVQGAAKVKQRAPEAVLVFLAPPSQAELARRLRSRGTEEYRDLVRRLRAAGEEMSDSCWFHHTVVNDDVERATDELAAIIASETKKP